MSYVITPKGMGHEEARRVQRMHADHHSDYCDCGICLSLRKSARAVYGEAARNKELAEDRKWEAARMREYKAGRAK